MFLTDSGAARLTTVTANLTAGVCGAGMAWLTGFSLWSILLTPVAGTLGWILGRAGGQWVGDRLTRLGYAPSGRAVYGLGELPAGEATAGGKARALSRLVRAGLPVPKGFVVLPRGFEGSDLKPSTAAVLAEELTRFPAGQRFAVRSSALAEDSATASFAGAYETVLEVPADKVITAIARVRDSGTASRVASYLDATGSASGELAVIVQAMVDAEQAGVLFTADPITGDLGTMAGSVVEGLGESLVSGSQTGTPFTITRPSGEFVGPDALRPFAARLHRHAHRIEGIFGGVAQDIEWAVASTGRERPRDARCRPWGGGRSFLRDR